MTKVIHVHLIQGRKNYYFGSIPAIYSVLTADEKQEGVHHSRRTDTVKGDK